VYATTRSRILTIRHTLCRTEWVQSWYELCRCTRWPPVTACSMLTVLLANSITCKFSALIHLSFLRRACCKIKWKSAQRRRKHCALEPKIFALSQTPFPGARDGQNLISWRWSLPLPTNPVWWRPMHAISSYRGNRPTNKPTDRTDYNTLRHR